MTRLTDTQSLILNAAAQRADRIALPLPANLRGGAAAKVVGAMLAKGLLKEVETDARAGEAAWRETGDGHGVTLVATEAGLAAIGVRTEPADAEFTSTIAESTPKRIPRDGTKQAALIGMLRTPQGATIAEIVAATGWQAHTVRGAFAGALKKKLGLAVTSEKVEGVRVYKIET